MKTRHFLYTVTILGFLCTPSASHASGGEPNVYFSLPTYIDLDYENSKPEFSYYWYNPKRMVTPVLFPDYNRYILQENIETPEQKAARNKAKDTKNFTSYQGATEAFNNRDYEKALMLYQQLHDQKGNLKTKLYNMLGQKNSDWSIEAATYMIGRTQMVMAQTLWDGYSDVTRKVDPDLINKADASFETYLKEYPNGLYSDSARNIKRRLLFLSNKKSELSDLIRLSLRNPKTAQDPFLFREFINFASDLPINVKSDAPSVIFFTWLGETPPSEQDVRDFEKRENEFATEPDLFNLVRAIGLYKNGRYKELTDRTAQPGARANHLVTLSLQSLRGRSYLKQGEFNQALNIFTHMLEQTESAEEKQSIELDIARTKIMEGDTKWLFSMQSPLKNEKVLAAIAQNALSDEELVSLLKDGTSADKRKFPVQELMLRYLLSKQFAMLNTLFNREKNTDIPELFAKIKPAISNLAKNQKDKAALLDIATYEYTEFITPIYAFDNNDHTSYYDFSSYEQMQSWCTPCQKTEINRATYEPPYTIFLEITHNLKAKEKSESEAKALHFLVTCFRGDIFQKQCKWDRTFENKGKQAFKKLHKIYPDSRWAKKTPYFYDDTMY